MSIRERLSNKVSQRTKWPPAELGVLTALAELASMGVKGLMGGNDYMSYSLNSLKGVT